MTHDNNNQEAKRLKMEQSQPSKIKPSKVIHIRYSSIMSLLLSNLGILQ